MRILFGITISMMHTMHDRISPGHQKRRPLYKPCQKVKRFLPAPAGGIHLVRSEPVEKKGMKK